MRYILSHSKLNSFYQVYSLERVERGEKQDQIKSRSQGAGKKMSAPAVLEERFLNMTLDEVNTLVIP